MVAARKRAQGSVQDKEQSLTQSQQQLMGEIQAAEATPLGYLKMAYVDDLKVLKTMELVDIGEYPDSSDVAVRLRKKETVLPNGSGGTNLVPFPNGQANEPVAAPPAPPVPSAPSLLRYPLNSGIKVPPAPLGGRREEEYPFSQMQVGDSFLVPVSDKTPRPWDTFGSTVSSATRRFSTKSETETRTNRVGKVVPKLIPSRKFTQRRVAKGDRYDNGWVEPADGVRVFRIE